jgi:preprotein translocase subunit SecY
MIEGIKRILSVPELKAKIVFTLLMLVACRVGAYIPVPGINGDAAVELFRNATGGGQNLFQLMDVFSGGAFAQMTSHCAWRHALHLSLDHYAAAHGACPVAAKRNP